MGGGHTLSRLAGFGPPQNAITCSVGALTQLRYVAISNPEAASHGRPGDRIDGADDMRLPTE